MSSIGSRIKELRKGAKLTLDALGTRVGISNSALSLIENGKNTPSARTVKLIARELGASEQWILTGEGDPRAAGSDAALEAFIEARGCSEDVAQLLRAFFSLTPAQRAATIAFIREVVAPQPPADPPQVDPQEE